MRKHTIYQQGLSLVELLIAMALGLMLTVGALQMMLSSQTMFSTTDSLSRIQENGRFALEFISKNVRMAGYDSDEQGNLFLDANTLNGAGANSDQFAVLLNPNDDEDCLGNAVGANDIIANVYFINVQNQISSLYCRSLDSVTNNWYSAAQPLVDGVENMQVLYGLADETDNYRVTKYVPENDVPNWGRVGTLKISLLINNGQANGASDNLLRQFVLLDQALAFTDRHSRQVFSTTITLNSIYYKDPEIDL